MADLTDTKDIKDNKESAVMDPRRKREIIKTILIIFLAVLLILTFCSNTIMNKSLAEISTERAASGKLVERIQEQGPVESNQSYDVTVDGNKTIDTIMVKKGQAVKKGDVLFTTGGGTNEKIDTAEKELDALKLEYQKALLELPTDYSKENQEIAAARDELNAAIAKRDQFIANQGNAQAEKAAYAENNNKLKYYTKLQTKLTGVIAAMEDDMYATAAPEYTADLVRMKNEMTDAENAYNAILAQVTQIASEGGDTSSLKAELDEKNAAFEQKKADYTTYKNNYRAELVAKLEDAENNVDYYTSLVGDPDSGVSSSVGLAGGGDSLEVLEQDVKAKQTALETAIAALDSTKKKDSNDKALANLDLDAKKKSIDKAQEALDKLKKENSSSEIKAKYSGVVSDINVKPGEDTVPGTPIATIDLSDEGYTVKISVDAEKCKKIKKGIEAEVVNNWDNDITAVLTDIKNDSTAGARKKQLVFSLTGDVESGSSIDLSIPCGSGNYDTIVPKSAVHNDIKGDFVLTVSSKSSPLGNRYYAERVDVQKLAEDEVSVAVSGMLTSGDYVITASSRNIKPNDQVRMKEK